MLPARHELMMQLRKMKTRPIHRFAQSKRPRVGEFFLSPIRNEMAGSLGVVDPLELQFTTVSKFNEFTEAQKAAFREAQAAQPPSTGITAAGAVPLSNADWLDPSLHLIETQMRALSITDLSQVIDKLRVIAGRLMDQIKLNTPTDYDKAKRLQHINNQLDTAHSVMRQKELASALAFITDEEWADSRNSLRKVDMDGLGKDDLNRLLMHYTMVRQKLVAEKKHLEVVVPEIDIRFRLASAEMARLRLILGRIDDINNQTKAVNEVLSDRKKIADAAKAAADAADAAEKKELARKKAELEAQRNQQGQEGLPVEEPSAGIPKWVWGLGAGILVLGAAYVVMK